ncbi:MAG: D-alanyl-D-alanine carboxypeptidase [Eubacterium sp.]|nr:D-alanyl-D-alanine carboxypeptidase [Eubacterium sp.]
MLKKFCLLLCFMLIIPNNAFASEITISAQSAVVMDAYTKTVLFRKEADIKRAVASTTKIMTCLIACESKRLNEKVKITNEMLLGCEGSLIYLKEGDVITLYDLVCGAMIASGNDAANAIAYYLSGGIEEFAGLMNLKAKEFGMNSTEFVTPSGLDEKNNHSTAFDMALLASEAVLNKELLEIASKKSAEITINNKKQTIYNHNKLLSYSDDYIGIKTGFTKKAGRCLISAYNFGGSIIVCVTLSASDDWNDHKTLVNFAKKCYKDINQMDVLKINTVGADKNSVEGRCELSVKALGKVEVKRYYYPFAYAPINKGDKLGKEEIYINKKLMKTADITANEDVKIWQTMK